MTRWRARAAALVLAAISMAHVGSPDTFFGGKAGPYDVRISVRLPGVIPGRAQVTVRVAGRATAGFSPRDGPRRTMERRPEGRAAARTSVAGSRRSHAVLGRAVVHDRPRPINSPLPLMDRRGRGRSLIPVLALATAERQMPPWLGGVLAALGDLPDGGLAHDHRLRGARKRPAAGRGAGCRCGDDVRVSVSRWPAFSRRSPCGEATGGGPRRPRATAAPCCTGRLNRQLRCRSRGIVER